MLMKRSKLLTIPRAATRMLLATLLLTMTAQTAWADTAVSLQQDGSEYYVNMLSSGTSILTLNDASITTFKVYDDGGKNNHYAYTENSTLKITVPVGYVINITGNFRSEATSYDYWRIWNGHVYSDGTLFDGQNHSNPASIDVQTTGNKAAIWFHQGKSSYSDDSRNLELTLTLIDATKDIAQATVTGMKSLYSHTGSAISLGYTVTAYNSSTPLTKGTDFTETITKGSTTVTNAIDEGNYTLTITGKSPYFGSLSFDFTVGDYIAVTNTTTVMNNCPYRVQQDVTISDRIVIQGDVTLTLEEGCTLTAQQGIQVTAGNTLTIDGTGSLTIQWGSAHSAGIGSGENEEYGHIIINGGTINTHGNSYGAGIGGGYYNPDNGNCCITINGGIINTSGGQRAAGIGGGSYGSAGKIVINGGQVTARTGGSGAGGIGKGYPSNDAKGLLTLDWTRESDFVDVDEYNISNINFVGKDFVLDEDNTITATTYNIAGKKIVPKLDNLVLNHATMNNLCSLYRYTGSEIALDYTIKSTDGVTTLVKGTDYSETIKKGDETVTMVKDKGEYTLTITGLGDYYTGTKSYTFSVADIDENLTQDGNEYYVNLPSDGSTKTVCLGENQTIKVYDSEGKNGSLVTCDGYLLLQAPDGYALEVWGKTDAMKYNAVANALTNSLAAYEGNTTDNEIITLQSNSDDIMFASGKNVMLIRLNVPQTYSYNNAAQYGLDLTVRVIQQQPYSITKGDALNGSISIADNKTTALTNETITLEVNPADGYLLKRVIITDTDNGQAIKTIGEDFWYSGKNTVSFKMPNRNITLTPEFDNNMTTAAGWAININSEGTSECVIPENIQSFNLSVSAPRNGENSRYITVILNAHDGFYLQATGNVDFDSYNNDWSEFGIYDGSGTSSPSAQLTNIQAINKDSNNEDVSIDTQTSSSNYMTFYLKEFSTHNSLFTGTIETKVKNYNITYDLAGGSIATDANPTTYNYKTDAFTLSNPTRKGYEFAGWTGTGLDAASTSVTIAKGSTGVRSYTATWNIITYNITYNNAANGTDGVTNSNPATYTIESEAITLDTPTKDGYTFAGWFDNAGFTGSAVTTITAGSTGDKTFWAKWIQDLTYGGVTIKDNGTTKSATLDASQESTISITSDVVVNAVELNRDFTANQPATVMLPFSLGDGQTINGGSFYKFSGVTKNGDEWKAQFTEVATLKANTPYLFMPSATGQMTFDLNGGTVTLNTTTAGEAGSTSSNWEFRGTYAKVQWAGIDSDPSDLSKTYGFAKGNATIAAGQFVHFAAGAWLKPMRCYLVYNGSTDGGTFQNAPSRTRGAGSTEELPQTITVVLLSSSGETTAIGTLDTKTGDITLDGWYTMDGRKLEGKPTKKGLYINNGRKIVIK